MAGLRLVCFVVGLVVAVSGRPDYSKLAVIRGVPQQAGAFYHSTDGLLGQFDALNANCAAMSLDTKHEGDTSLKVVTLKHPSAQDTKKLFVTFNVHGREYITGETALRLAQVVCGAKTSGRFPNVDDVLKKTTIKLVPVVNRPGRVKVEQGRPCKDQRKNGNGVDINRNFDAHFGEAAGPGDETYPGPQAMSEPETKILAAIASDFAPHAYLDVHSGERGMGWPFAYDANKGPNNEQTHRAITSAVNQKVFDGQVWTGRLAAMGGASAYTSMGTTVDYMYEVKKVQFAGTWEIWAAPQDDGFFGTAAKGTNSNANATPDAGVAAPLADKISSHLGGASVAQLKREETPKDAPQLSAVNTALQPSMDTQAQALAQSETASTTTAHRPTVEDETAVMLSVAAALDNDQCFAYFNPLSEASYERTVKDWADAVLALADNLGSL